MNFVAGATKTMGKTANYKKWQELQEMRETLQRLQAEFENYTKRAEKERQEFKRYASASTIKELLPVIDSIDSAIEKMEKQEGIDKKHAVNGLKELRKHFIRALEKQGLKEIDCMGKMFDPELEECLAKENNKEKEDGIVLEEIQKGYLLNEKVLRTAKVKVNAREEHESTARDT